MYEETKRDKEAMVMKYALAEQKRSDYLLSCYDIVFNIIHN